MKLPESWRDIELDCGECDYRSVVKGVPEVIFEHLIQAHHYTQAEAQSYLDAWREDFSKDEDGNPLDDCPTHGPFVYGQGCGGCDRDDYEIERWKESRGAR